MKNIRPLLFLFFGSCLSVLHCFSQSHPTYILKVNLNDSVKHYLEHEALSYFNASYEVSFNVGTWDMDTAVQGNSRNAVPSLAEIKKQQKLICHCGKDVDVYHEMGCIYDYLNMTDSAMANYNRALEWCKTEEKKFPDSLRLQRTEAMIYMHKKDYNTSIEKFENLLKKSPSDSLARISLPVLYLGISDTAGLLRIARENLTRNPADALSAFYYVFGQAIKLFYLQPTGQDALRYAKTDADSVIDFRPVYYLEKKFPQYHFYSIMDNYLHLFAYFCLKIISIDHDKIKDQRKILSLVDTLHLGHYQAWFGQLMGQKWYTNSYSGYKALGFSYLLLNKVKEASGCFRKAIDLFPESKKGFQYNCAGDYSDLALCRWILGDSLGAEQVVKENIRNRPGLVEDPGLYLILAKHQAEAGDFSGAKKNCATALRINPNSDKAYTALACIGILEKNYKEALNQLDKAFKVNNNEVSIVIMAGIASLLNGSPDTAHTLFKQAYDYDNSDEFVKGVMEHYFF